jgi:hypothetical protein
MSVKDYLAEIGVVLFCIGIILAFGTGPSFITSGLILGVYGLLCRPSESEEDDVRCESDSFRHAAAREWHRKESMT